MEASPTDRVNLTLIIAIVAVATIGGFMFGYDSGAVNGTQEGLETTFNLSKLGVGFNVGAILLGCAAGAFGAGRLADVMGRRNVMLIAAVAFFVSAITAGAAGSSAIFIFGRILGGIGVGAASVLSPAYISEVTPAAMRGRLSSAQQIMIITGLTGAFVVNYVLAQTAGSSTAPFWLGYPAWRWMYWMQAIPAMIFFVALLFIPESPRYLVARGRDAEAEGVLSRLFGPTFARQKLGEIKQSLISDHPPRFSDIKDRVSGRIRPIIWAGIMLAVFQQLVGINVIFYYGATLWQAVGFGEQDALKINILSGSLSILACIFAILVIDRIGRKPLLLVGSAGMAISLFAMVIAFASGSLDPSGRLQLSDNMGMLALIAANAYVVFFNLSWGPVMWVMLGEMFPNQIRGSALAICGLAQWLANFFVSMSFPWAAERLGLTVTYSFYAISAVISFFLVQRLINETRGRELEAMEG